MYIHPVFPLWGTSIFEFPEWRMRGSSSFKYFEDNDEIVYEISVPDNVDDSGIVAELKDSVLTLKLPKVVESDKIKINKGS